MNWPGVGLVIDGADPVAGSQPVVQAAERLGRAAKAGGTRCHPFPRRSDVPDGWPTLLVAGAGSSQAEQLRPGAQSTTPHLPESIAIVPVPTDSAPALLVSGSDERGLAYAVHELADRFEHSHDAAEVLRIDSPIVESPANRVRSVTRLFCSEAEDKVWFYDEAFWEAYLSMLVSQRFNRFSLTLGLGYNYPQGVTDAYMYFAYPFLVEVAGYDVTVPQLAAGERDRNLAMLTHISDRAHAHGLDFQLGLWTHAYQWIDSPHAHHTIEGLTPEEHGPYCREAIRTLLESCPSIDGVTLRTHGESGVPERSWDFWRDVFDGISAGGRTVGLDLHAKGLDEGILESALKTGLPVTISPKFWAEHMGLPYHQAAIRESERPPRGDPSHLSVWHSHMAVSEGSRPFTRYGFGDFLREDRPYDLVFRMWAGTQRLLLWGDPIFAAGYGRAAATAGGAGLELMEPLTFKGREGTGSGASRTGYVDAGLVPNYDWEKYAYTYRLFGRLSYDPDASPETWRRHLKANFGTDAPAAEQALANASRILPLVTVAHHQSASNNYYWPEIYTTMPVVESLASVLEDFLIDTLAPKRFGTVDPLDPEVFVSTASFVDDLIDGRASGRIGPLRVAAWLDELAERARNAVASLTGGPEPEKRRWILDTSIQAELGSFFAAKLRAATYYEIHLRTGATEPLRNAIFQYQAARAAWSAISVSVDGVYASDVTFGPQPWLRGHWSDRLRAIDADIRAMTDRLERPGREPAAGSWIPPVEDGEAPPIVHVPPLHYRPGEDLTLLAEAADPESVSGVDVRFRPMNQALPWNSREMEEAGGRYSVDIAAREIGVSYPLSYAFLVRDGEGRAWRVPDLGQDHAARPYHVVRCLNEAN